MGRFLFVVVLLAALRLVWGLHHGPMVLVIGLVVFLAIAARGMRLNKRDEEAGRADAPEA